MSMFGGGGKKEEGGEKKSRGTGFGSMFKTKAQIEREEQQAREEEERREQQREELVAVQEAVDENNQDKVEIYVHVFDITLYLPPLSPLPLLPCPPLLLCLFSLSLPLSPSLSL